MITTPVLALLISEQRYRITPHIWGLVLPAGYWP